ncbi:hypothetical protein DHEL01_v211520 [Diaporthe helianthi]|uniref:Cytochrome P450 n=1 Tax=Diaporthe helianthi TaxID=158607 RepID=A0A2P5HIM5_DIAHE|nr:hypothetical protein DHEL01_v211520 [Diaporthe helianthi]
MPIIGNWVGLNDRHGKFFDMSEEEVESWKRRDRGEKDIVGLLVDVQRKKPELNDNDIKYMMSTNIFAGSDTTSTSLRGTMLHLLRNPDKMRCLMEELEGKMARGELSDPPTYDETMECPYLQAVMYEGVRLYPAIGSPLARVVPEGGMYVDGRFAPEGTIVGSSAYIINRLPQVWGPDANEFRPERWLDSKENVSALNLSWLEMSKMIPWLLLRYDLTLVDGDKVYEEYGFLVFIRELQVVLKRRARV